MDRRAHAHKRRAQAHKRREHAACHHQPHRRKAAHQHRTSSFHRHERKKHLRKRFSKRREMTRSHKRSHRPVKQKDVTAGQRKHRWAGKKLKSFTPHRPVSHRRTRPLRQHKPRRHRLRKR